MTPAARVSPEVKSAVLDALRAGLTEERTDALIAKLVSKLPWWLRWLPIEKALDALLPGALFDLVDDVL